MKYYWEIIADNLSKAGWSWGCVSAVTSEGRIIWVADAHRDDGKRFVVRADEKLTAFLELGAAVRRDSTLSLLPLDYRIPHIRPKSNRQNSPRMLLEKKFNGCGELGIKRGLNPARVL